jgi:hypothetical protein
MNPKDTFSNLYLGLYQDENEKSDCPRQWTGLSGRSWRTVRQDGADCLRGSWGRGAALDVLERITDRPRRGAGPSAHLVDRPQGRRGLSARAARRWVPGREKLSLLSPLSFPNRKKPSPPSLSCSISKKKPPPWGF